MHSSLTTIVTTEDVPSCPQCNCNTGIVAGAVVVVLLSVIIIVTGVVLVTYLVLRHKRGEKM